MKFNYLSFNDIPRGDQVMNISLSSYEDIDVYYRAGDNSSENLEPTFVAISKANHVNIIEVSSENNIINGKIDF